MSSCAQQPPEFPITHNIGAAIRLLFHSQLFITPPAPTQTFTNQTVIITGANRGVGLEAARHFYRLDCARLILAVRDVERGQVAKENILSSVESRARSESDTAAIEVWYLDLRSTESTIAFADRVKTELDRVDVLVENAGIHTGVYELVEGVGSAVQVNILNTCLLALLLLPKLEENSGKRDSSGSVPHLVVVSSEAHRYTSFPEINEPDLYEGMKGRELGWEKFPRYCATKLIQVLFIRGLVARLKQQQQKKKVKTHTSPSPPPTGPTSEPEAEPEVEPEVQAPPRVIINLVTPGFCSTPFGSDGKHFPLLVRIIRAILDRTVEVGSRTLVLAASAPATSHGEFQADGKNQDVEAWIYGDVGRRVQGKFFEQTVRVLETRYPGVMREVGLEG